MGRSRSRLRPGAAAEVMGSEELLRSLYASFNARDADAVLAATTEDVDWPNAWEGGRVRGHEAVRAYWTRQWAEIDPHVEPVSFTTLPDGRVAVDVLQTVRTLDGDLISENRVVHVYETHDALVSRMTVEEPVPRS
jgi:hypothetical protein